MLWSGNHIDSGQIFYNGEPLELDGRLKSTGILYSEIFKAFSSFISSRKFDISPVKTMGMKQEEAEKKAWALERFGTGRARRRLSILIIWWAKATGGPLARADDWPK